MTASRRSALALAAVCLLGFALRVVGLQYGLPAVYNPDEVSIMARALSFARGTLNPHNFLYPTFYFYVLFAWVGVYLALGLVERPRGVDRSAAAALLHRPDRHLHGRAGAWRRRRDCNDCSDSTDSRHA